MSKQLPKAGENWFGILHGKVRMFTIQKRGSKLLAVRLRDSEWGAIGHYVEDGGIKWLSRVLTHEEAEAMRGAIRAADDLSESVTKLVCAQDDTRQTFIYPTGQANDAYSDARANVKIGEEQ